MTMISALTSSSCVLFQGDSITDANRSREHDGGSDPKLMGRDLGKGYPAVLGAEMACQFPGISVQQLGIAGNRIVDLAARAQEHIWNHQPNLLSILIGVNDTWHHFMRQAGVDLPRFERTYRDLLRDSRERLPNIAFVLCHPFVLPCGVVGDGWRQDIDDRRAIIDQLSHDFNAVVVPFQDAFDAALERAPAEWWASDGVHPSPAGHWLMAQTWRDAVWGP